MRKTKIICTIGPASENEITIKEMALAGMNVARLNFSHNTYEDHYKRIALVKKVREELNLPIAIMLDTKGPEYRIRTFENGKITLNKGDKFTFTTEEIIGNQNIVSVSYKNLHNEITIGDKILVNTGLSSFTVISIDGNNINCVADNTSIISDKKSMSFPGKVLNLDYLSEKDKEDLLFGIKYGVDFVACSFVSKKDDLLCVKEFLHKNGGEHITLIAKIENQSGIDNIEEICSECDGIMIGRCDMGVEIPFEELPIIQKKLITKCRMLGKRVITATEMLESMIHNVRPTRAEISDVANAVFDGTSAIMLSGETAMGDYPALTVKTMADIAKKTEESINYKKRFINSDFKIKNTMDAISHSVCGLSMDIEAKAMVICSLSGTTARMVSRFRSPVDIIGLCVEERISRQLALSWGVTPVLCERYSSVETLFSTAKKVAKDILSLEKDDKIIITGGDTNGKSGNTSLIKVEYI